jgi:hypothetical protein
VISLVLEISAGELVCERNFTRAAQGAAGSGSPPPPRTSVVTQ